MRRKKNTKKEKICGIEVKALTKTEIRKVLAKMPWHKFLTHMERYDMLVACKNDTEKLKDVVTGEFIKELSENKPLTPLDIKTDTEAAVEFFDNFCETWLKKKKKYAKKVERRRKERIRKAQFFQ